MTTEEIIRETYLQWDREIENNNVPGMSAYMADDWVCVGSTGITTKSDFLQQISGGDLTHTTMSTDFMRLTVYDNSAIIVGRGTSAGAYKGRSFNLYEWSTNVFTFQNNKWLCVLTMLTPASPGSE